MYVRYITLYIFIYIKHCHKHTFILLINQKIDENILSFCLSLCETYFKCDFSFRFYAFVSLDICILVDNTLLSDRIDE